MRLFLAVEGGHISMPPLLRCGLSLARLLVKVNLGDEMGELGLSSNNCLLPSIADGGVRCLLLPPVSQALTPGDSSVMEMPFLRANDCLTSMELFPPSFKFSRRTLAPILANEDGGELR